MLPLSHLNRDINLPSCLARAEGGRGQVKMCPQEPQQGPRRVGAAGRLTGWPN